MNPILYIKFDQKYTVSNKKVLLKDIAKMKCNNSSIEKEIGNIILLTTDKDQPFAYSFSIMRIVEEVTKLSPGIEIINFGESDFIIEYMPPKSKNYTLEYIKTSFIAIILFIGAGFTIMTFNQDVNVGDLFDKLYELILGTKDTKFPYIEVAYSVGIAIGVLVFFNHFKKKKTHNDPTPIQIEMEAYETTINDAIIANCERLGETKDIR